MKYAYLTASRNFKTEAISSAAVNLGISTTEEFSQTSEDNRIEAKTPKNDKENQLVASLTSIKKRKGKPFKIIEPPWNTYSNISSKATESVLNSSEQSIPVEKKNEEAANTPKNVEENLVMNTSSVTKDSKSFSTTPQNVEENQSMNSVIPEDNETDAETPKNDKGNQLMASMVEKKNEEAANTPKNVEENLVMNTSLVTEDNKSVSTTPQNVEENQSMNSVTSKCGKTWKIFKVACVSLKISKPNIYWVSCEKRNMSEVPKNVSRNLSVNPSNKRNTSELLENNGGNQSLYSPKLPKEKMNTSMPGNICKNPNFSKVRKDKRQESKITVNVGAKPVIIYLSSVSDKVALPHGSKFNTSQVTKEKSYLSEIPQNVSKNMEMNSSKGFTKENDSTRNRMKEVSLIERNPQVLLPRINISEMPQNIGENSAVNSSEPVSVRCYMPQMPLEVPVDEDSTVIPHRAIRRSERIKKMSLQGKCNQNPHINSEPRLENSLKKKTRISSEKSKKCIDKNVSQEIREHTCQEREHGNFNGIEDNQIPRDFPSFHAQKMNIENFKALQRLFMTENDLFSGQNSVDVKFDI